jgi:hypothetical protein
LTVQSIRKRASFAPQTRIDWKDRDLHSITNVLHETDKEEERWIAESTARLGDWRDMSRTVYLRWSLTMNAMEIARDHYAALPNDRALQTVTLRAPDGLARQVPLAIWSGPEASKNYAASQELVAAYGFADLYGVIEDITFDAYEIYLRHHPEPLMQGANYKSLRQAWRGREKNQDAWRRAWSERYDAWRRKKLYDGLGRVVRNYWAGAGLRAPSNYRLTDIGDWVATTEMFGKLRNHIKHSATHVTPELAEACAIRTNMGFSFKEGDALVVELHHLMAIECFVDQYLTALNISLLELVHGRQEN